MNPGVQFGLDLPNRGHEFFYGNEEIVEVYLEQLRRNIEDRHVVASKLPHYTLVKDNWLKLDTVVFKECVDEVKHYFKTHYFPMGGEVIGSKSSTGPLNDWGTTIDFYESREFQKWFPRMLSLAPEFNWFDLGWLSVKKEMLSLEKLSRPDGPRVFMPQGRWMNAIACLLFRQQNEQLKESMFYSGGWHPFHGKFDNWVNEMLRAEGFYFEEDAKKYDISFWKVMQEACREIRTAASLKLYRPLIKHIYDHFYRSGYYNRWKSCIEWLEQFMPSGHQLTSGDNSLRNFLRWFYICKKWHKATLSDMMRGKMNILGDDSLNKLPFLITEEQLIIGSAHCGIISKGFTVPPSLELSNHSFLGLKIKFNGKHYDFEWDNEKLVDSCRYKHGLTMEEFEGKVNTIMVLLSKSKPHFKMVKSAAEKFFDHPFESRRWYLRYYAPRC